MVILNPKAGDELLCLKEQLCKLPLSYYTKPASSVVYYAAARELGWNCTYIYKDGKKIYKIDKVLYTCILSYNCPDFRYSIYCYWQREQRGGLQFFIYIASLIRWSAEKSDYSQQMWVFALESVVHFPKSLFVPPKFPGRCTCLPLMLIKRWEHKDSWSGTGMQTVLLSIHQSIHPSIYPSFVNCHLLLIGGQSLSQQNTDGHVGGPSQTLLLCADCANCCAAVLCCDRKVLISDQ